VQFCATLIVICDGSQESHTCGIVRPAHFFKILKVRPTGEYYLGPLQVMSRSSSILRALVPPLLARFQLRCHLAGILELRPTALSRQFHLWLTEFLGIKMLWPHTLAESSDLLISWSCVCGTQGSKVTFMYRYATRDLSDCRYVWVPPKHCRLLFVSTRRAVQGRLWE